MGLRRTASLEAIEAIYRSDLPRYRRVARAILRDEDAARDVVQEAFAAAVRERRAFRGEGEITAWVWRIVVNAALAERRRRSRSERWDDEQVVRANGRDAGEDGDDHRVAAAVGALPDRQRLVVFLHYYADLDYGTVAHALSISSGTVAATLNAARKTLLKNLTEEGSRNE